MEPSGEEGKTPKGLLNNPEPNQTLFLATITIKFEGATILDQGSGPYFCVQEGKYATIPNMIWETQIDPHALFSEPTNQNATAYIVRMKQIKKRCRTDKNMGALFEKYCRLQEYVESGYPEFQTGEKESGW